VDIQASKAEVNDHIPKPNLYSAVYLSGVNLSLTNSNETTAITQTSIAVSNTL
jgi:hypothetical protein